MSYFVRVHSLGWHALLSLSAKGRGLALPQLSGPGFVDPPGETLPCGRSGWEVDNEGGEGGGVGERTVFGMQNEI